MHLTKNNNLYAGVNKRAEVYFCIMGLTKEISDDPQQLLVWSILSGSCKTYFFVCLFFPFFFDFCNMVSYKMKDKPA